MCMYLYVYILYMYIYIILYIYLYTSHSGGEITQLPPDSPTTRIIQVQRVEVLKNLKGSHTSPSKSNKRCVFC